MMLSLRRLGALAGVIAMLAFAPCATADPDGTNAPKDPSTMSLSDLGATDTIWFEARRDITASTFSFVVPQGLSPASLNATLEVPVTLKFGYITVTQDGRTISRMPLPDKDQAPLVVPLNGVQAYDNWASVTLTITAMPTANYCWDPRTPIRLVNSSITFSGNEIPPSTVAAFLPPTLRRLTIAVPKVPSYAESSAAIQLAGAIAKRYGWQNTDIGVVPLPNGASLLPDAQPGERQIVLKEGPDKGLSLQGNKSLPQLVISGPGDELSNQARLMTDESLPYALSTKAVAGPLVTEQKPVGDSTTLDKLKLTGLTAEALRPEVNIKLDQSMFAEPLDGIRVHLLGSYTPLPNNFNGELTASVNDEIIDRWNVNAEGTIDHWVDIPNLLVQRTTVLKVRVHTVGDPGQCNDYLNMALRIDGDTEVQANRASPPVPPGFRSLPQALLPRVQIGITDKKLEDTIRAAQIIVGLQRNSALPIITTVAGLQDAAASRDPAILISANGWNDESLTLPFSSDLGRVTIGTVNEAGTFQNLTLDPAIKFGSLQTLFDGQRTVLIATSNGAPQQLDELLRWLAAKPNRWTDLDGRAIISVRGSSPVTVPNRRSDLPENQAPGSGGSNWFWLAAGGIAALALAGALWILLKTYQARTVVAEGADDVAAAGDKPGTEQEAF